MSDVDWVATVEQAARRFAETHHHNYAKTKREQFAHFEIGCFLAVVDDYEKQGFSVRTEHLVDDSFRYLTTPSGNPANFSYIKLIKDGVAFDLRQQVRIRSYLHTDITFTPDFVVMNGDARIEQTKDADYAGGRRGMFAVDVRELVALHECKSMVGFPELYVSFVGMLHVARAQPRDRRQIQTTGHLASTLFVGGEARALHLRMIAALQAVYAMNIVTGVHRGTWILATRKQKPNRLAIA